MKDIDLVDRLIELKEYKGEDKIVSSYDKLEELSKITDPPIYKFGIPFLDKTCDGMEGGELIAISGPRKSGKTLLSQTMTVNLQNQNKVCMWFSYEVTPKQFFNRFEGNLPFFILPNKLKMHSLDWVRDRILEAIAKCGVQVVFIDHLHYLFDIAKSRNVSIEIGQVIRFLKLLAIELEIVIVLMCHMTKLDPYLEPSDYDMRDSSMISAETDTSFVVWRSNEDKNIGNVKVCFHRRTGALDEKFQVTKVKGLFQEYTKTDRWSI